MSREPRAREPWPWLLAGLLGAMIGISLTFLAIAIRHPDPKVVEDAWASEPGIAATIRARQEADARGWALAVRTADVAGGVRLEVMLRDASGHALAPERVRVRRERPAEGGFDADLELLRSGESFAGEVPLPKGGRWTITVSAERDGGLAEERLALVGPG